MAGQQPDGEPYNEGHGEKAHEVASDRGLLFGAAAEHLGQLLEILAFVNCLPEVGCIAPARLPEPRRAGVFTDNPRLQLRERIIANLLFEVGVIVDGAPVSWPDTTVESDRTDLPTAVDRVAPSGSIDHLLTGPAVGLGELPAGRHVFFPPEDIDHVLRVSKVEGRVF